MDSVCVCRFMVIYQTERSISSVHSIFPYYIKLKVKKQILIPLLIVGVFAMTFLPLILWDAKELFGAENNPFSLQFRQGSPIATIFLVTIALTMSLTWKGSYQFQVLYSVIILLLIPIISYGYSMYIYVTVSANRYHYSA